MSNGEAYSKRGHEHGMGCGTWLFILWVVTCIVSYGNDYQRLEARVKALEVRAAMGVALERNER